MGCKVPKKPACNLEEMVGDTLGISLTAHLLWNAVVLDLPQVERAIAIAGGGDKSKAKVRVTHSLRSAFGRATIRSISSRSGWTHRDN
jgi:hypothetical protein